ncbi:unnamed protein product [Parajaminaea phylloscopi]
MFSELPSPIGSDGQRQAGHLRSRPQQQAFALLSLTSRGLLLSVRSALLLWDSAALQQRAGLHSRKPHIYRLFPRGDAGAGRRGEPSAWEDITALETLDDAHTAEPGPSTLVVVGRLNGRLELWTLDRRHSGRARLLNSFDAQAGRLSSVQKVSILPRRGLLAAVWKHGVVAVFRLSRDDPLDTERSSGHRRTMDLLRIWQRPKSLPWSVHMGEDLASDQTVWVAVGCHGENPLLLYRNVLDGTVEEGAQRDLTTSTDLEDEPSCETYLDRKQLAVYALSSLRLPLEHRGYGDAGIGVEELFIGCYDGTVRVLNLASRRITAVYKDAYDDSPVYSLVVGIGPKSRSVAVGTARHGVVKMYEHPTDSQRVDHGEPSGSKEGWSIFPPHPPATCPTYSVAGEHGRIFCAGMDRVWEFDARRRITAATRDEAETRTQTRDRSQAVAWYQHREMILTKTDESR